MVAENFVTYEDFGAVGDGLTNSFLDCSRVGWRVLKWK